MLITSGRGSAITSASILSRCRRKSSAFAIGCVRNGTLIISYEPEMSLNVLEGVARTRLEAQLPDLLKAQRWFGGKARDVASVQITDRIMMPSAPPDMVLLIVDVAYADGGHEHYALPITVAFGREAEHIVQEMPRAVLVHLAAG